MTYPNKRVTLNRPKQRCFQKMPIRFARIVYCKRNDLFIEANFNYLSFQSLMRPDRKSNVWRSGL